MNDLAWAIVAAVLLFDLFGLALVARRVSLRRAPRTSRASERSRGRTSLLRVRRREIQR